MAGVAGFEPTDARVKVWCLTPWLHPNKNACFYETSKTVGWVKGLEPSTPGTTIRCSNQLSYTHHSFFQSNNNYIKTTAFVK